jgi:hypothetical protein
MDDGQNSERFFLFCMVSCFGEHVLADQWVEDSPGSLPETDRPCFDISKGDILASFYG